MERMGTLRSLRRYPVKSMMGEDLERVFVSYAGLVGDRVYAFVDNGNKSSFPWMTGRQGHEMILYKTRFLNPPDADEERPAAERFQMEVVSPEGQKFRMGDPALQSHLEKRFGKLMTLRFSERAMTDMRPVSVFGLDTVKLLADETGIPLDHRRFRANFYVAWDNGQPYFEKSLVGKTLRIGENLEVNLVEEDPRCIMITLDPESAKPVPEVLKTVSQKHGGCAGVYGAVLREGIVKVEDPVYVV